MTTTMPDAPTMPARDTLDKASMLMSALQASARPMDHAGTVAIITEDQLPGGLEGFQDAIDHLRTQGYDIRTPKAQEDLSKRYPECRGRTIQLVATPEGALLKNAQPAGTTAAA